ncbi:acyl-CoA dehydrogenase family protein [Marinobacter sp. chi1]|uniref:Acyl-CoA dehydrogenase family protein n=1 Tax=Marinobacter suaedae TaxID=3057675 RepID=A0ABT8VY45_9GAMM|nr:acyl-CoA dehydrogenase family protein [Marinobacter sp. chi1]MDO3720918.1 acyl-CoA dehydrogenase family protein [Marinobacter sp. chi1]
MKQSTQLFDRLEGITSIYAANGQEADNSDRFSVENYQLLKQHNIFSAMVPEDLGGGGASYSDMCQLLQQLAGLHPATTLSLSMHQHIVAANRYNHTQGRPGKALLEKVAANELALISTGAGDWLASNGTLTKTEGGYLMSATKHFASGSPGGDVFVTSAPYEDPEDGWMVFHFPVSTKAEGVQILDNWRPMGMRGSGSNSVVMKDVFVPEETIAARRPRGEYHAMWSVVLPVALPLIMSVYCGIAKKAAEKARERCKQSQDPVTPYLLGEMENALTTADITVKDMIRIVDDFNFTADLDTVNEIVKRKTIAAEACKETARKAVEACGGPGYLRDFGIESLLRDVMASHFHPLQEKRQHLFTGSLAMGQEPPGQAFQS